MHADCRGYAGQSSIGGNRCGIGVHRRLRYPRASKVNYELVIFDWDGTLMDSTGVIAASLQDACRDIGIVVPTDKDARYVIGLRLADSFDHVAPGLDEEGRRKLSER